MAIEVFLPRLTHDMSSGIFVRWLKGDGELVKPDEALFEVETDKAVTEVAAQAGGILCQMDCKVGDEILIGTVIAYLLSEGEDPPEAGKHPLAVGQGRPSEIEIAQRLPLGSPQNERAKSSDGRIIATPIARRMARHLEIDLAEIAGSGPNGRIIEADVRAYHALHQPRKLASAPITQEVPFERIPLSRIQLTTGRRMVLSSQTIPQFVLEVDVVMSEALRLRQYTQWEEKKAPSVSAVLIQAVARALQSHPRLNASLDGEYIKCYQEINVGVATATTDGLLVPVIHKANTLLLRQIQEILDEIRDGAARGKIQTGYLSGGTFTLSNLGMYGVHRFQALINPPEVAILAAGGIQEMLSMSSEGAQVRPILTLRLSCDHRVLDGATASLFLIEVKNLLENPYEML